MPANIAILTGGPSPERSVCLLSAKHFEEVLLRSGYAVDVYDLPSQLAGFLSRRQEYTLALPVGHGVYFEDGQITAFLKTLSIPYLFSPFETHVVCMDKWKTASLFHSLWVLTPKTVLITSIESLPEDFSGEVFIKPRNGGSSIDSGRFQTLSEGKALIEKILTYDTVIAQEYIAGHEFTATLLWDASDRSLICPWITEVVTDEVFFDFHAKYESSTTQEIYPARLNAADTAHVRAIALQVGKALGVETMARVDWIRSNDGKWYALEVNTIPGFTQMSFVPKVLMAEYGSVEAWLWKYIQKKYASQ